MDVLPQDLVEAREHVAKAIQLTSLVSHRVTSDAEVWSAEYANLIRALDLLGQAGRIIGQFRRVGAGCPVETIY